jgi:hypothetical protein
MSPNPTDPASLPIFIPEWSVWDTCITHHYEDSAKNAKDFMYELVNMNVERPVKLGVIPDELKEALDGAFGDRLVFDFLMEHGASHESIPNILTRHFASKPHHRVAVFLLGFWKSINFPEVYIVTEDESLKETLTSLSKMGLNFAHSKIIDSKTALQILREKCK